ncbi:MAG TPA: tetratricopeptide repeat protein [Dongiaceae bacterium]
MAGPQAVTSGSLKTSRSMIAVGIGLLIGGMAASVPLHQAYANSASGLAYQDLLRDPSDLGKTFAYAEKLVEERNFESAAAVLERLAIRYPQQPEIRLELGVMYYRLNSPQMAKDQFQRVLAMAGADQEVKRKAEEFLLHADPLTKKSRFSGNISFGMRYQSNATGGASKSDFSINGLDIHAVKKDDDVNGVVGFNVNHVYDFDSQWGAALESSLAGRGGFYVDNTDLNEIDLRGRTGLGFTLPGFATGQVRLQPHVTLDLATRDAELLELGGGPGVEASYKPLNQWKLTLGYDAMFRDYEHVGAIGDTQLLSGTDQTVGLNSTWEIVPRTYLINDIGGHFFNARRNFLDYESVSAGIALLQGYNSPFAFLPYDWWIRIGGGYEHRWFDSGDPSVDANKARRDNVWHASLSNVIPITEAWRITQQFDYERVQSNLATADYDNYAASLLATWQF